MNELMKPMEEPIGSRACTTAAGDSGDTKDQEAASWTTCRPGRGLAGMPEPPR